MIGPNSLPMLPVPYFWITNSPIRTAIVAGRMKCSNSGAISFSPSIADKHRDRRRDDAVAVEQGSADHAEQDQRGKLRAIGDLLGGDQREQCQDTALAVIVGPQHEDDVFQRDHHGERPENQRDDPEDVGRGRSDGRHRSARPGRHRAGWSRCRRTRRQARSAPKTTDCRHDEGIWPDRAAASDRLRPESATERSTRSPTGALDGISIGTSRHDQTSALVSLAFKI